MSEIELKLEQEKCNCKEVNAKRLIGALCLVPYLLIGFIEMFKTFRADKDFKQNMLWFGAVGLAYFFNREVVMIFNFILKIRGVK